MLALTVVREREVQKMRGWILTAIALFAGVMLVRTWTHGIWAGVLLVIGGMIVLASGFISSSESH